jgi:hypothetical protein
MLAPIFIVGCPRSGTTLLRDLLRSHPNLTFPPESQFIPRYYRAYGNPNSNSDAIRLGKIILNTRSIRTWEIDLKPESFADCRTFQQVLYILFEAWRRRENKARWGDKTPQYVNEIPLLLELFPSAQIIHIIRDGRDVALSALKVAFEGNLFTAADRWRSSVRAGREAGARLSTDSYLEIRYEDLLERPECVMKLVCDFLNEPFDPAVLRPCQPLTHGLSGAPWITQDLSHPKLMILKSNALKWQTVLRPAERILFSSVAGDLLEELGYQAEGTVRHVGAAERWAWHIHHCFRYVVARLGVFRRPDLIRTFVRYRMSDLTAWVHHRRGRTTW